MTSNVDSVSEVFYKSAGQGFSQVNSQNKPIHIGMNRLNFQLPYYHDEIRFDPVVDGASEITIHHISIHFPLIKLPVESFEDGYQLEKMTTNKHGEVILATPQDASDPQWLVRINEHKVNKVRLILSVLLGFLVSIPTLILFYSRMFLDRRHLCTPLVLMFTIYLVVYFIVGLIPVNDGYGWDGGAYYSLIQDIINHEYDGNDPYRLSRIIGGFSYFLVLGYVGLELTAKSFIYLQLLFSTSMMVLSCVFLYKSMLCMGVSKLKSLLSIVVGWTSWALLIMPVFYPLLTDHLAFLLVSFSLYCWMKKLNYGVLFSTFLSIWVLPSMVLPLLILSLVPYTKNNTFLIQYKSRFISLFVPFVLTLTFFLLVYFLKFELIQNILVSDFLQTYPHSDFSHQKGFTGSKDLLSISILAIWICFYIFFWFCCSMLNKQNTLQLNYKCLGVFFITILTSFILMRYFLDFNKGFSGPPLLDNMIMQSIGMPFKAWVAHVAYWGPIVLVVYLSLANKIYIQSIPSGLFLSLVVFIPILSLGSETRQWLVFFPIIILAFSKVNLTMQTQGMILLMCVLGVFSMFFLSSNISDAIATQSGFFESNWQYYFSRLGPWMNTENYVYFLIYSVFFILLYLFLQKKKAISDC